MNDLGKAFSGFFKDPAWFSKTLVAAVFMILSLLGIGILILAGYCVQLTQRVIRREEPVLPRWNELGRKFVLGFKFCVAFAVYLIPFALLLFPVVIALIVTGGGNEAETVPIILSIYLFGVTLLLIPYGLFLSLISPIILYRFAERERIGDAIDVVRVVRLFGGNWQNALIVALISTGLQSVAGVGIMLFGVGIFFTLFYSIVVSTHLSGLLCLDSQRREQAS